MCFSFFFFKQKTAYEMRISDWSSDVCSSDLSGDGRTLLLYGRRNHGHALVVRSARTAGRDKAAANNAHQKQPPVHVPPSRDARFFARPSITLCAIGGYGTVIGYSAKCDSARTA